MRPLIIGLLLGFCAFAAQAQEGPQCAPGEYLTDISKGIDANTAKVWLMPAVQFGAGLGKIWVYQLGRPENKRTWGGGGPGSAIPLAFVITGLPPLFCVGGDGAENVGFLIYQTEPGA